MIIAISHDKRPIEANCNARGTIESNGCASSVLQTSVGSARQREHKSRDQIHSADTIVHRVGNVNEGWVHRETDVVVKESSGRRSVEKPRSAATGQSLNAAIREDLPHLIIVRVSDI
jgi:hypothetical protein